MTIVDDVTELAVWQLAHKLHLRVDLFLLSPDFRRHYQRVDRLSDAARSAPRNIEEGFVKDDRGFAYSLRLARSSQIEVLDHLDEAYDQRLITLDELAIARRLARRSITAANGLIRSLDPPSERVRTRAKRRSRPPTRSIPRDSD